MKIYIVRHGQNEDNAHGILNGHRDLPLTSIGLEQAQQIAMKIKESWITFDKIYSSPLQRAYKTAEIIATTLSMELPEKEPALIERDFGEMTWKLASDIEKLCAPDIIKTDTITYFLSPVWAETFPMLLTRAKNYLRSLENQQDNQTVLLVTHWDIGKMLYAAYYDMDWKEILTMFHFGNSELLLLSPESWASDAHVFMIPQYNH